MNREERGHDATTGLDMGKACLGWCRLPRLARLLEALGTIGSTRLTDNNHLWTDVVAHTLETRDEALRTLAFTTKPVFSSAT